MTDTPPSDEPSHASVPVRSPLSSEDALPPVEVPGAGFILQLFILPAIIVVAIVTVWLLFSWIARGTDDPRSLIRRLATPSQSRFQAAHELASVLRSDRYADFKQDGDAAAELAAILSKSLSDGGQDESEVSLQVFICRALGEFHVDEGLDTLIEATGKQHHVQARKEAVAAIALRAEHAASSKPPKSIDSPKLTETMLNLADDRQYQVREVTAFTLVWLRDAALRSKLEEMLEDPFPNVRYNAALACSRIHNLAALEVLEEMLDPNNAGVAAETDPRLQPDKRNLILVNALRAVERLSDADPQADLSSLKPAIAALQENGQLDRQIRMQAGNVLGMLKKRRNN